MIELIKRFITTGGPIIGPLFLSAVMINVWLVSRVERRDALYHVRLNYALLDKCIFKHSELVAYSLVNDSLVEGGLLGAFK